MKLVALMVAGVLAFALGNCAACADSLLVIPHFTGPFTDDIHFVTPFDDSGVIDETDIDILEFDPFVYDGTLFHNSLPVGDTVEVDGALFFRFSYLHLLADEEFVFRVQSAEEGLGNFTYGVHITFIPIPAALWMFVTALGGLGAIGYWRHRLSLHLPSSVFAT